jgi:hypothetical protein
MLRGASAIQKVGGARALVADLASSGGARRKPSSALRGDTADGELRAPLRGREGLIAPNFVFVKPVLRALLTLEGKTEAGFEGSRTEHQNRLLESSEARFHGLRSGVLR